MVFWRGVAFLSGWLVWCGGERVVFIDEAFQGRVNVWGITCSDAKNQTRLAIFRGSQGNGFKIIR